MPNAQPFRGYDEVKDASGNDGAGVDTPAQPSRGCDRRSEVLAWLEAQSFEASKRQRSRLEAATTS